MHRKLPVKAFVPKAIGMSMPELLGWHVALNWPAHIHRGMEELCEESQKPPKYLPSSKLT